MEVKLLMIYNIKANREAEYFRYVLGEFLPALQQTGLYMIEGWHTHYGDYPSRLLVFRADSKEDLKRILKGDEWKEAKEKLMTLIRDYEERIVPARKSFQFFIPSHQEGDSEG